MFTPLETSIGAILLHQATSTLLYQNGNILGISGFLRQLLSTPTRETLAFFAGMAASYIPLSILAPQLLSHYPTGPMTLETIAVTIAVGLLVGWGTKMSNGCTSGHMLCGISRLSGRSAAAVATFFPVALLTHHLTHPTLSTQACPIDNNMPCYTPTYPSLSTATSLILLATASIFAARTAPRQIATLINSLAPAEKPFTYSLAPARLATLFFSGLLFALGLHISGMSSSSKVLSFFSFPSLSLWDPSLLLVILFAVVPNFIEMRRKGFNHPPSFADAFSLPKKTFNDVDANFVAGAAAFGVAWGLTGTCPGPAVLRAMAQPVWGALWMGGFWAGGKLAERSLQL